ncbi:uncharacterized protein N7459_007118, partial [Penicillium hispanicum]|uniref:uncharacterized protein n=1 Tax=Penicillium hispanicum TaxID=1080232 RepID=UPI002540AE0C
SPPGEKTSPLSSYINNQSWLPTQSASDLYLRLLRPLVESHHDLRRWLQAFLSSNREGCQSYLLTPSLPRLGRPWQLERRKEYQNTSPNIETTNRYNSLKICQILSNSLFLYPFIPMARNKELTPAIRERICELHAIGWGYKRIHKRYPWIPLATIRYTVKKEPERCECISKPRSGRPRKLNELNKERIMYAIQDNPKITREDLLAEVDNKVKYRLIFRLLNADNMRKWRCSWRPYLTEENALKRLRWAI